LLHKNQYRAVRATIASSLSRDEKRRARMRELANNGLSWITRRPIGASGPN